MFLQSELKKALNDFFKKIKLLNLNYEAGKDKAAKIDQIIAYLEIIYSQVKNYSKSKELIFIDSCAGNCHLSFLVYFYFSVIEKRTISIHCVDYNERLMNKNRILAKSLGFDEMYFHHSDIGDFEFYEKPHLVYSLHACDTATDMTQLLGLKTDAKNIITVTCCQHSVKLKRQSDNKCTGMTKNKIFKDRLLYMLGDSLRALLLQMQGYKVDIIEFVSSRATDKNVMIRARRDQIHKIDELNSEYENLKSVFNVTPALEKYIRDGKHLQKTLLKPVRRVSKLFSA